MMVMGPPQHRQRGRSSAFPSSAEDGGCVFWLSAPRKVRILSMLAARTALANRP